MLEASQPWLPLIDLGPMVARPPRAVGRRARKRSSTPTLHPTPGTAPSTASDTAPDGLSAGELWALRHAFLGLVARWDLSGPDTLALIGEPLASEGERVERLGELVGVNRLLLLLHSGPEQCRVVLRQPCPALGGDTPLQAVLMGGQPAIVRVRGHLAALANH